MSKLPNINEIREVIWGTIQDVKKGLTTAGQANAVTNATGKYLSTVKLEMEYCKLTRKQPDLTVMFGIEDHSKIKALAK